MKVKMLRTAREKGQVTHKGKPVRLTADLSAETLQVRKEWEPILTSLNKILYRQAIAERFCYHLACLTRAPEGSTEHRKEQPVPVTAKTHQIVKPINTMKKLHQLKGKKNS